MITDDDVMRLFERADPARVADAATPRLDATEYLDALRTRSNTMTMIQTRPPAVQPPSARRRWPAIAAAAAAFAAIAAGAVVVGGDNDGSDDPSRPAATMQPITTEAPEAVAAEAAVSEFLDAYGAFDADRALGYLTPRAIENLSGSAEQLRDELAYLAAVDFRQAVTGCDVRQGDDTGVRVRCEFDMQAIGAAALGLGPFSGNYWNFNVVDGRIDAASYEWTYEENGFAEQVWEPFEQWLSSAHPSDAEVMYTDASHTMYAATADSRALWAERTADYTQSAVAHLSRARSICAEAGERAAAASAATEPAPPSGSPQHLAILAPFLERALAEIATLSPPPVVAATFDQLQATGRQVVDLWAGTAAAPTLADLSATLAGLVGGTECTFGRA